MKKIFALAILISSFFLALSSVKAATGGDERAPMQEKEFKYKDWTFKALSDGKDVNLRSVAKDKKLTLVVYFAAWCPNWRNEAPLVEKLYEKYKDKGFNVIGVSEFASLEDTKKNIESFKITFPIVTESETTDARDKVSFYEYRTAAGDTRRWGSPWNVFLTPKNLKKKGDVLAEKAFIVNGELIEAEVEAFIRKELGLPAEAKPANATAANKIEVCEPATALKKP